MIALFTLLWILIKINVIKHVYLNKNFSQNVTFLVFYRFEWKIKHFLLVYKKFRLAYNKPI